MLDKENKNIVSSQNRAVDSDVVEGYKVEVIRGTEEFSGVARIEATTEEELEDLFEPEYGGSD